MLPDTPYSVSWEMDTPKCNVHPTEPLILPDRGFGPAWECRLCNDEAYRREYDEWIASLDI